MAKKVKEDKVLSDIHIARAEHFKNVGKRLKELRTQTKLSRENLDKELEFSARTVERFEYGDGGNPKSLLSLLLYYANLGYNLNWILLEDNSNLFKKEQNIGVTMDLGVAESLVEEITDNAKQLKKLFDKII